MTLDTAPPDHATPPHLAPLDDEAAILGACLVSPTALDQVLPLIPTPAVFHRPGHAAIWAAITACWEDGQHADPPNVNAHIHAHGATRNAPPTLTATLYGDAPTGAVTNPAPYLHRVLNAWQLRAADTTLVRGRQRIAEGGDAGHILDALAADVETAQDMRTTARNAVQVGSLIGDVLDGLHLDPWNEDDGSAIPWPYRDLGGRDGPMNPLAPGQMIGIAGRPGSGKSTVMKDACEHCSFHQGWPSLLVSYEMKAREITARVLASQARVQLAHLTRPGLINDDDLARVQDYRRAMEAAQLWIVDAEDTTIAELDRLIRHYQPRLVAIDYLQLAVPDGPDEQRRARVERFSRAVKQLAGRREVPILAGSQLNRANETRRDKTPQLSDLRESGAIENDCDAVILCHRPDMYEPHGSRVGEVDLIVAKQRNGPTGTVTLANRLHYAQYADMAQ